MNYENIYNRNHPGLIIFLIDQSAKTFDQYIDGSLLSEMIANCVNEAILELINKNKTGNEIINRCFIYVVSYESHEASILFGGLIKEYVNGHSRPIKIENCVFDQREDISEWVEPKSSGGDNPLRGFELTESLLDWWKSGTENENFNMAHVPVLIHIGTGLYFDDDRLVQCIKRIQGMVFKDGNPIIINFIYNPWSMMNDTYEYSNPQDSNNINEIIAYEISSPVNPNLAANSDVFIFYKEHPENKFFFVNPHITPRDLIIDLFKM